MMTTEQARADKLVAPASLPFVVCVMPANGRLGMVFRAVSCFQRQTYPFKRLVIFDTGEADLHRSVLKYYGWQALSSRNGIWFAHFDKESFRGRSLGVIRNAANQWALNNTLGGPGGLDWPQVICHWDSDDWSHPRRLEEQVAHLVASWPAPCVGYNQMLFWDTTRPSQVPHLPRNAAWLYDVENPAQPLGTSLMYWRDAWEKQPFRDMVPASGAEDCAWLSALHPYARGVKSCYTSILAPRMIASIHGNNTSSKVSASSEWKRVPMWDEYCRKEMQL